MGGHFGYCRHCNFAHLHYRPLRKFKTDHRCQKGPASSGARPKISVSRKRPSLGAGRRAIGHRRKPRLLHRGLAMTTLGLGGLGGRWPPDANLVRILVAAGSRKVHAEFNFFARRYRLIVTELPASRCAGHPQQVRLQGSTCRAGRLAGRLILTLSCPSSRKGCKLKSLNPF